jgi:hypothetical protein
LEISSTHIWDNFVSFIELSKVNNHPRGEKSPNLVTLVEDRVGEKFMLGQTFRGKKLYLVQVSGNSDLDWIL